MQINIDMNKLDAAVALAQPKYQAKLEAKSKQLPGDTKALLAKGFVGFPMGPVDGAILTFCGAWPKVRTIINIGLRIAAWFPGYAGQIALAKAWLEAFNTEIVPMLCQPPQA